jgi:hypothetical protein
MEYLDRPHADNTPNAHPAFFRGQSDGIKGAVSRIKDVIEGKDEGKGIFLSTDLEKVRRVLLKWREFLYENKDKNHYLAKKIQSLVEETDNILK